MKKGEKEAGSGSVALHLPDPLVREKGEGVSERKASCASCTRVPKWRHCGVLSMVA